jgi:hypothetical protein
MAHALRTTGSTIEYADDVAVHKVSVSLDENAYNAAVQAAELEGISLSAWLSHVALEAAGIAEGLRAVREFEEENGPFTEEELRWAQEVIDRHGIGRHDR